MAILTLSGLADRQEPHVITQTIIQASVTYTTLLTLGTTMPTREPEVTESHSENGISSLELGGILGAIVGAVVLFILCCFCCGGKTRQVTSYIHEDRSASNRSQIQHPPAAAEQIPGGPRFPTYRAVPIPNPRDPQAHHYYPWAHTQ
jgi:hypothetical protein